MNQKQLLSAVRSVINYHAACGITSYPVEKDVLARLATEAERGCPGREMTGKLVPPQSAKSGDIFETTVHMNKKDRDGNVLFRDIMALATEVENCTKCPLCKTRRLSCPGKGGTHPLLLVVGNWLATGKNAPTHEEELFGREQDMMLAKMMSAIKLTENDVYITNTIKCGIPDHSQPTKDHIAVCSRYLQDQIEILRPKVICTMGIISTRLLTGRSQPLSRQRGHFFSYKTRSGLEIPLMPTYHPTFLIKNSEMKKETWADLQVIQNMLQKNR